MRYLLLLLLLVGCVQLPANIDARDTPLVGMNASMLVNVTTPIAVLDNVTAYRAFLAAHAKELSSCDYTSEPERAVCFFHQAVLENNSNECDALPTQFVMCANAHQGEDCDGGKVVIWRMRQMCHGLTF